MTGGNATRERKDKTVTNASERERKNIAVTGASEKKRARQKENPSNERKQEETLTPLADPAQYLFPLLPGNPLAVAHGPSFLCRPLDLIALASFFLWIPVT